MARLIGHKKKGKKRGLGKVKPKHVLPSKKKKKKKKKGRNNQF